MPSFQDISNAIRFLSIDAVNAAKSGHPGMPMGMADIMTVLYRDFIKFNPKAPNWEGRDRLVLSNGHGSMLLYSILHLTGYDVTLEDLKNFRKLHSKTAGHPEFGECVGVETTTGPLGQGVANAVGMAIGLRKKKLTNKIYVTVGDGCLMEGISHEALELAGAQKLNNLVLLFDDNNISIDGEVSITSATNVSQRLESYGFQVLSADGHNETEIKEALTQAQTSDKPVIIRFKTHIGYGSPSMANTAKAHGSPLGNEERFKTAEALNWPYGEFEIPKEIYATWRSFAKHTDTAEAPNVTLNISEQIQNSKKQAVEKKETLATRKASGLVLEALQSHVPNLISGSADLTGSVNTLTSQMTPLTAENPAGTFMHYGVREHGMAAVMNGLALTGFIPTSGTFLAFADYMKPAMRLSALMKQQVIYVLTHDSIGLGEDGPTHQPVEQLSMLRAMPNFNTFRPCDLSEMAECWQLALETNATPSAIIASRQGLPNQRKNYTTENLSAKGAYVIYQEDKNKQLDAVLMASGSEVHLATQAAEKLNKNGKNVRVLSVPCIELFLAQGPVYQAILLPAGVKRIAIEAAARQSWDRFLNDADIFIGMDNGETSLFGASAPAEDLYAHFGISTENIMNNV